MEIEKHDINALAEGVYHLQPTTLGRSTMPGLIEMGLQRTCPYCHSEKVQLLIRGTLRQYQCKQCGQFFRPN